MRGECEDKYFPLCLSSFMLLTKSFFWFQVMDINHHILCRIYSKTFLAFAFCYCWTLVETLASGNDNHLDAYSKRDNGIYWLKRKKGGDYKFNGYLYAEERFLKWVLFIVQIILIWNNKILHVHRCDFLTSCWVLKKNLWYNEQGIFQISIKILKLWLLCNNFLSMILHKIQK